MSGGLREAAGLRLRLARGQETAAARPGARELPRAHARLFAATQGC